LIHFFKRFIIMSGFNKNSVVPYSLQQFKADGNRKSAHNRVTSAFERGKTKSKCSNFVTDEDFVSEEEFGPPPPELFKCSNDDSEGFRFSVSKLPDWAKVECNESKASTCNSTDFHKVSPRKKWGLSFFVPISKPTESDINLGEDETGDVSVMLESPRKKLTYETLDSEKLNKELKNVETLLQSMEYENKNTEHFHTNHYLEENISREVNPLVTCINLENGRKKYEQELDVKELDSFYSKLTVSPHQINKDSSECGGLGISFSPTVLCKIERDSKVQDDQNVLLKKGLRSRKPPSSKNNSVPNYMKPTFAKSSKETRKDSYESESPSCYCIEKSKSSKNSSLTEAHSEMKNVEYETNPYLSKNSFTLSFDDVQHYSEKMKNAVEEFVSIHRRVSQDKHVDRGLKEEFLKHLNARANESNRLLSCLCHISQS